MLLVLIGTAMLVFAESFSNYYSISVLVAVTQFKLISALQNLQDFTTLIVAFVPHSSISFSVFLLESFNSGFIFFHSRLSKNWLGWEKSNIKQYKQTNKTRGVVRAKKKMHIKNEETLLHHRCARVQHSYTLQPCFLFFLPKFHLC